MGLTHSKGPSRPGPKKLKSVPQNRRSSNITANAASGHVAKISVLRISIGLGMVALSLCLLKLRHHMVQGRRGSRSHCEGWRTNDIMLGLSLQTEHEHS